MHRSIGRVAQERGALARRECGDNERAGADGPLTVGIAFRLHDFARNARSQRRCQKKRKYRVRLVEPNPQGLPVDRDQAGHRRVVVDCRPGVRCALGERVEALDPALEQKQSGRADLRIEDAPEGIREVRCRKFSCLAAEGGVRREADSRTDADREFAEIRRNFGQGCGCEGNDDRRARERVEHIQSVVDAGHQHVGLHVVGTRRIQRFRDDRHPDPEHALGGLRAERGGGRQPGREPRTRT